MNILDRMSAAYEAFKAGQTAMPPEGDISYDLSRKLFETMGSDMNPSELVRKKGLSVFDRMRKDDQVKAALLFKKHAVLSSGWEVVNPEGVEDPDWEVRKFVEWNLQHLENTLEESLLGTLSAIDYGFSIGEKIWESKDTPYGNGMAVLKAIKDKEPHGFQFIIDEFGNLDGLTQGLSPYGGETNKLPVEKFVIFTYDKRFGNWYGTSDLEAAYRPWWTKDNVYKWMAMYMERLGIPPIFALYDPNHYSKKQQEELQDIMKNLQAATSGTLPAPMVGDGKGGRALDFWTPELAKQIKSAFTPVIDMLNKDIARALLMPGMMGFTPDEGTGSLARSQVHRDAFVTLVEFAQKMIEERVMKEQVIKQLVDLNYPSVEEYPIFKFLPMTDETRLDLIEKWTEAVEKGVVKQQPADESHMRDALKFPERDIPADERYEPTDPTDTDDTGEGSSPDEDETHPTLPSTDSVRQAEFSTRVVIHTQSLKATLDSLEGQAVQELVPLFEQAREAQIRFYENNRDSLSGKLGDLKLKGMGQIRSVLREFLRETFRSGRQTALTELKGFSAHARKRLGFTPRQAVKWLDNWEEFFVSDVINKDLLSKSKNVMMTAMRKGEPVGETVEKLRKVFEPFAGDPRKIVDGEVIEAYRLETIVRTNASTAFNQGRLVEYQQHPNLIQAVRFSAILDPVTTPQCTLLNGKVFKLDDPELGWVTPPLHFRCRSILTPVTITEKVNKKDFITPSKAGRAKELTPSGFGGSA